LKKNNRFKAGQHRDLLEASKYHTDHRCKHGTHWDGSFKRTGISSVAVYLSGKKTITLHKKIGRAGLVVEREFFGS